MKDRQKDRSDKPGKGQEKEENLSLPAEFWEFAKHRKRYWLLPILLVLLLMSFLMVFAGSSSVAPFIYPLF